jgi:hypothetical protein
MADEKTARYEDGAHFWRDTATRYGRDEALGICGRYLETQLKLELPEDEKQFCVSYSPQCTKLRRGSPTPPKLSTHTR